MPRSSSSVAESTQIHFASNRDHLRAEFGWLELILKRELSRSTRSDGTPGPLAEFAGLYVPEGEMRQFLTEKVGTSAESSEWTTSEGRIGQAPDL